MRISSLSITLTKLCHNVATRPERCQARLVSTREHATKERRYHSRYRKTRRRFADAGDQFVEDRPAGTNDPGRRQIECGQIRRCQFGEPHLAAFDQAERKSALTRPRPPASATLSRSAGEGSGGDASFSLSRTAGEGGSAAIAARRVRVFSGTTLTRPRAGARGHALPRCGAGEGGLEAPT